MISVEKSMMVTGYQFSANFSIWFSVQEILDSIQWCVLYSDVPVLQGCRQEIKLGLCYSSLTGQKTVIVGKCSLPTFSVFLMILEIFWQNLGLYSKGLSLYQTILGFHNLEEQTF